MSSRKERRPLRLREGHALLDAIYHRLVHEAGLAEVAFTLGILGRSQVTQTRFTTQQLARGGEFEPLGHGFFSLSTCNGSRHGAGDSKEFP